ncbi:MAG TPA: hypothetical protein VGJ80_07725 [Gemmatimonadales bacterium]|jgi:hypothetical protein
MRTTTRAALLISLSIIPTFRASAQVGHDPGSSPYRDILLHSGPIFFVGHLGADRGTAGAGTSNATTFGARYEIPAGRSLQFQFTGAYLHGDRFIINPRADSSSPARRTGPFESDLAVVDVGMQLRLTGGKTWRGFAPYVGTGLGIMFDVKSPGDTTGSGYRFGTKLTLAFASGVRWYPARRVMITGDLRAQLWRLKYPLSFHDSTQASDGSRVLPLTQPLNDWTLHPWISLGIGWTF